MFGKTMPKTTERRIEEECGLLEWFGRRVVTGWHMFELWNGI